MSGKKSQHKGRAGELELSRILRGYGYQVEPGQAVSYGATPDVTGLPGIHIECKRAQQQSLYSWVDQARRDADKFHDGLPAVFWRKDRRPWLVVMDLRDWMALYGRLKKVRQCPILTDGKGVDQNDTQQGKSNSGLAEVQDESGGGGDGGD